MSRWDDWGWGYYEKKPAREVKGGIKAQSKRGGFGESWWAKRWIGVLESFDIGARLQRGKSYARRGQVASIDISEGVVKAKVQGSSPRPYSVSIKVKLIPKEDCKRLAQALSQQAIYTARLLAGEMPQEIEEVFKSIKLSLFPEKLRDLETDCSCPDWSNPCKHIAAVYYLIGEEFDRDPFLIFKLRGIDRDALFKLIDADTNAKPKTHVKTKPVALPEPLTTDVADFWHGGHLPDDWCSEVSAPPVPAALLKRLGNFPFWRGKDNFQDSLEPVYKQSSVSALEIFIGDKHSAKLPVK